MYIPKWGSNFCFTFPTSEGSDLLSSHVMQTPTFISKLSDGNVIFRLDVGKNILKLLKNNTKQPGPGLDCLSFFLDFVSAMPHVRSTLLHANKKFVNVFYTGRDNNGRLLPVAVVQK
jgi:hypothetical protein